MLRNRKRQLGLLVLAGAVFVPFWLVDQDMPTAPRAYAGTQEASSTNKGIENTKALGGHWHCDDRGIYFYEDGRWNDLFTYHQSDSNKDNIPNIRIRHDREHLIIESQGYPNHPTAIFPNSSNPNSIRVQDFVFKLPLEPRKAKRVTRLPMGPIGVALNGVVFFNPFEFGGMNAVEGYSEVWLDSCCGHPQRTGVYHYHKYPTCVKSPFRDDGKSHSPIIGFAFDGFPIYGPYEAEELMAKDLTGKRALDSCNGHSDDVRGYHYHVTPGKFPYIIGGYAGVPEPANNPVIRQMGTGAIRNNASGKSRIDDSVQRVEPRTIRPGQTVQLSITLSRNIGALPTPSWIQLGPYEAKELHSSGRKITATIVVPEDASIGSLDLHLEFENRHRRNQTQVLKKNDAVKIVD